MINWVAQNIASIVLLLAVILIIFFILRSKIKQKQQGRCCCGCSGQSSCRTCRKGDCL
ncbi:MAG: FeoB-associated Cys-rich membrane protein [Solobacterium sp.]|nr:FeoB-associated Cys-rich membrane protein [Solobacterium sp.]MBR3202199.1 FeoB-associated Cys-rich membrane protein [Solobacterium sp.]